MWVWLVFIHNENFEACVKAPGGNLKTDSWWGWRIIVWLLKSGCLFSAMKILEQYCFLNRICPCNIDENILTNVTMSKIYLKIIPRSGKTRWKCLGMLLNQNWPYIDNHWFEIKVHGGMVSNIND